MIHRATHSFWESFKLLPPEIQKLARENFVLFKSDPLHPSLHFKKVGRLWSVRVGIHFRAVAVSKAPYIYWNWIGRHDRYEQILRLK